MSREMFSGNLRNRLHSDEWLIWQDQYEAKENLKHLCVNFPHFRTGLESDFM